MHILVFLLGLLGEATVVDLDHELPVVQGLRHKGEETGLAADRKKFQFDRTVRGECLVPQLGLDVLQDLPALLLRRLRHI